LRSRLDVHELQGRSCIAFSEVSPEEISSYGCVDPMPSASATGPGSEDGVIEIRRVVEKPPRDKAPSNLAIIGRYVFTPEIFTMLDLIVPGRGGELQLTDAIAMLLENESVFGCNCRQGRYDVGQKIDFLRANVEIALDRADLGPAFGEWLRAYVAGRWPV
jgi:UTP--glucose-1-phosphate uridylyltransferase